MTSFVYGVFGRARRCLDWFVRGFYFLFCCVKVSSVVLCLLCCIALCCNPLTCSIMLCCVALCCDPLCCVCFVALRCTALWSVVLLLCCTCWVVLCCDPFRCVVLWAVVLRQRCLVLCCVVDKFSISSIPSMLKLYISRHNQPHSLADNLYTRELDKLNHPYQIDKLIIFHLL